jgi:hypothetical protein
MSTEDVGSDGAEGEPRRRYHRKRRSFWKRRQFWIALFSIIVGIVLVLWLISSVTNRHVDME